MSILRITKENEHLLQNLISQADELQRILDDFRASIDVSKGEVYMLGVVKSTNAMDNAVSNIRDAVISLL